MKYDIAIVGGGIVGLATALRLKVARPDLKMVLLEKEKALAQHQTGNNSGVIHSGIYYKPGSLKAKNCIEGYKQLLEFCEREQIHYELCGKIIVATDASELPALATVYQRGIENGLKGLKKIAKEEIKDYEPYCTGIEGIYVPQTGIIDYKKVALKYAENFRNLGGEIILGEKIKDIRNNLSDSTLTSETSSYQSKVVVNCAGLFSDRIAAINNKKIGFRIIPFRGEYFELKKERQYLVKNLIYPVPDPAFPFLGVHFTRMAGGGIEAGPNAVFSFKREGYKRTDFDLKDFTESISWPGFRKIAAKYWRTGVGEYYRSFSKPAFTKALQRLIPDLKEDDLLEGGAGVRAQACDRTGGLIDDFLIMEDKYTVNVCNAPSPAATSSYSIGKTVSDMVLRRFS